MNDSDKPVSSIYTCNNYREEMILLALRQKLQKTDLSEKDRAKLIEEAEELEKAIGF